ncbi:MAG: LuxR C-terminal-related transcriptional regulator [Deltaproteobacteria bacterium]|nr:LuxR C-terminal-related transcriptional regulator [Deltaproteobacteria bacterium]
MLKQVRILAVDDEPDALDIYHDAFSSVSATSGSEFQFDVTLRTQGDQAVDAVREALNAEAPFAVIFLDMKMPPGPDGLWTGEQIRQLDPDVNFVVVTGCFDIDPSEIVSRILPEDKMLYVQKPFHLPELRQFATALGAKWHSERLLRKANAELEQRVNQLKISEKNLLHSKSELENLNNQLMETNHALSVLARNLDGTRKESERRVLQRTRTLILPIVEKLLRDEGIGKYYVELNQLMWNIENLSLDFNSGASSAQPLSASEMRIAAMIKNGMRSEEIAKHLHISLSTVKTHRKNIRRKLNLTNSGRSLQVYMTSHMGLE